MTHILWAPLVLACLPAGCQSADETGRSVHFVSAMSPGEPELVRHVMARFAARDRTVAVRYEPISGSYMTLLQTRLAAGSPPDLFTLADMDAPDLIAAGALRPLDDLIARDKVELGDFYPSLVQAFTSRGKIYGLPKDFNTLGLYYNRRVFAEAHLQPPRTWDELRDVARQLTFRGKGRHGLCLTADLSRFLPFLHQAGGEFLDAAGQALHARSPEGRRALGFYLSLLSDGMAVRPDQVGATWSGEAFGRGLVAMVIEGGWLIPTLRRAYPDVDFGVAELPRDRQRANLAFTVAYVIPRSARNPQGAWTLMKYLLSREGMQAWTELGLALPSRRSVPGQTQAGPNAAHWRALAAAMPYARSYQFTYRFAKVLDRANFALEGALLGRRTVDGALADMVAYGDRVLAQTRRRD